MSGRKEDYVDNQLFGPAGPSPVDTGVASPVAPDATPASPPLNPPRFVPINADSSAPVETSSTPDAPASTPSTPSAPETPTAPRHDDDPRLQKLQEYERAFADLQQMALQAEQQRREQEAERTFQSRRESIYETARNLALSPEDQLAYIRRHEDQEVANLRAEVQRVRQEAEQQKYAAVAQIAGPMYAQNLARQHQLPDEYAQRLAMLPPQQMDHYLPVLVQEYQQRQQQEQRYNEVLQQLDQLRRSQQAGAIAATGAHTVTNATPTPSSVQEYQVEAGSRDHLLGLDPRLAAMFGYKMTQ